MGATASTDFVFVPKVWQDHVSAYFRKKLVFGSVAVIDRTLQTAPGLTVDFPYFKKIGGAQEPAEDESLQVDNLSDDSFYATVKEIGKAVGFKKKSFKKSGASQDRILAEAQEQIGRVMAEKVDADILTEMTSGGNYVAGFTATDDAHTMSASKLLTAKIKAFGDRSNEAIVVFMHSLQYLNLMADSTSGFLKADALDPMYLVQGFMGRVLGMAVIATDQIPQISDIDSTDAYTAYIHKAEPYGVLIKQDPEIESDYDILARETVITGTQWYAVKSFHAKTATDNYRSATCTTTVKDP